MCSRVTVCLAALLVCLFAMRSEIWNFKFKAHVRLNGQLESHDWVTFRGSPRIHKKRLSLFSTFLLAKRRLLRRRRFANKNVLTCTDTSDSKKVTKICSFMRVCGTRGMVVKNSLRHYFHIVLANTIFICWAEWRSGSVLGPYPRGPWIETTLC